MIHQRARRAPNKEVASNVVMSLSSVVFSIIASSHHWLHMGILLLLGGSTNMMAGMTGALWIRRFMIVAVLVTTVFSIYRLMRHKRMPIWMKTMNFLSLLISFAFIMYTLIQFGW